VRGALSLKPSYYEALRRLTLQLAGVEMGSDHAFLVETRLSSLARKEGFDTLDSMVQELFSVGKSRLAIQVVSALVERDTHFNRDPLSFDTLFNIALPDLIEKRGGGRIDLLSYGCGSGQDIYSIAIRARYAAVRAMMGPVALHMTGVDYPSQALERARSGRYTHFEVQRGLSARDLVANFTPDFAPGSTDWLTAAHLQENVTFQDMHLMAGSESMGEYHIVMFRGAIAHYSRTARVRVIRSLTKTLRPYGYLILGSGEDLQDRFSELEPVAGSPGLYRRLKHEPMTEPVGKQPNGQTTFEGPKTRRVGT
jgi:chemotaxis protein methyltransferase CheR